MSRPAAPPSALHAAREAVVVCDVAPLALLYIAGPDAAKFLQGQLSSDVTELSPGTCQYSSFNSPKGRMLANFVIWREDADDFRILLPADIAAPIGKRLSMYVLRSKVTLSDGSTITERFGIGGPEASRVLINALPVDERTFGVTHAGGATILALPGLRYVVIAPAAAAPTTRAMLERLASPAPFPVWQWLTIRAGVPVITAPTQDQFVAQTANWDLLGGVNFRKGCYTGQEIIARMQYLGRQKERLFAFHADAASIAAGTRLFDISVEGPPCGTVVNAAPAPEGGCDLLAVVQLAAAESGTLRLQSSDGPLLSPLVLPYSIPAPEAPRGRIGPGL
jgi:folate-binding protein YgfZ